MSYGVTNSVRILGGNPPTSEVADSEINLYIGQADSLINVLSGKSDWTSANVDFNAVVVASNLFAASLLLDVYQDKEGKAAEFRKTFYEQMDRIRTNSRLTRQPEWNVQKTGGSES